MLENHRVCLWPRLRNAGIDRGYHNGIIVIPKLVLTEHVIAQSWGQVISFNNLDLYMHLRAFNQLIIVIITIIIMYD